MDAVRTWAFSVCSAMAVCGLALELAPKSSFGKIFKLTASAFFLCCLLSPVVIRFPAQRAQLEEYSASIMREKQERLSLVAESQARKSAQERGEKIIREKLSQMGINYYSAAINIITNGQSEAEARAHVILDPGHAAEREKISAALEGALGMPVRLEYAERE